MNRIYQGRVTKVEVLGGKGVEPQVLKDWPEVLWKHHELFQDAVNYYTLGLAAMGEGLTAETAKGKAIVAWRDEVKKSWLEARRKAIRFEGPHRRLAKWLNVSPGEADADKAFDACAKALLQNCPASLEARAQALLQLLEEADEADLNQFCVARLPWLCTGHGKLDATPKNVAQAQEHRMLQTIREIHDSSEAKLGAAAKRLDLGCFVTQPPREQIAGVEARAEAERLFKSAVAKAKALSKIAGEFSKHLECLGEGVALPVLGRKPKGAYPLAAVFKLYPCPATWEAFKKGTESLRKKAEKTKEQPAASKTDLIAEVRTEADQPVFDYFTNRALVREPESHDRAVWFEFDLAAFIEAIKSPHRYLQDTLTREAAAAELREKLHAIDPEHGWRKFAMAEGETQKQKTKKTGAESEDETPKFTFAGDSRVSLLRKLVTDTLGHLAEAEEGGAQSGKAEYTVQERTLRGWGKIRDQWRKLALKGEVAPETLWDVVKAEQGEHRDDFGSAALFQHLAEPEFQPIWRDKGTQAEHAPDLLEAWRQYKELEAELEDKDRSIRFTPAHAEKSPRFFIIPKVGKYGSEHEVGAMAFSAGMVLKTTAGLSPAVVRVQYSAPRLRRDGLRRDGETNLEEAGWVQPMIKALELREPDLQDFSNCRITLQPESEENIGLTFPVEIVPEKLMAGIGKAGLWSRQFNLHPDGDGFYNASLRWPHEKQPTKPPVPWFDQLDRFTCVSVDLGQRDAGAYAWLMASSQAEEDFGKRPSRFIGETDGRKKKLWRAALISSGVLRLPGEDRMEWRGPSASELVRGETGFGWREELYGECGRSATPEETAEVAELFATLGVSQGDFLEPNWGQTLAFPEQNDKLLLAVRRFQSRVSRLHRWCWFLAEKEKTKDALKEIRDACGLDETGRPKIAEKTGVMHPGETWLPSVIKECARKDHDPRLAGELKALLGRQRECLPRVLEKVANRILPMREAAWDWGPNPEAKESGSYLLTKKKSALGGVKLRGQRGLSMERIEQIEELRRRFQSLNQIMRREIGGKAPLRRDETIPDPCPDLLEKLDNLKEQRVFQTAHMILAEALGVRLAEPPANKAELRQSCDQHGVYERIRDKNGKWRGIADFIVIEDLSRYRATQGRAPRENSRLMKWCHRAVRDKLRQLCEPFGIPLLETPAAWSSRFCSRTGVAGFRAVEVHPGMKTESPWAWHLTRLARHLQNPEEYPLSEEARLESERVKEVFDQLEEANRGVSGERPAWHTLYLPKAGGPIFIPNCEKIEKAEHGKLKPAIAHADVNAAINLGLRAIADPRLCAIHPRFRTQRDKDGTLLAREKRKFGEKAKVKIKTTDAEREADEVNRNPNFFADISGVVKTGQGSIEGVDCNLVSGKALWGTVKQRQWGRCREINAARLADWRAKEDQLPM